MTKRCFSKYPTSRSTGCLLFLLRFALCHPVARKRLLRNENTSTAPASLSLSLRRFFSFLLLIEVAPRGQRSIYQDCRQSFHFLAVLHEFSTRNHACKKLYKGPAPVECRCLSPDVLNTCVRVEQEQRPRARSSLLGLCTTLNVVGRLLGIAGANQSESSEL